MRVKFLARSVAIALATQTLAVFPATTTDIAQLLNWQHCTSKTRDNCQLCNGYFKQPVSILKVLHPPPYKTTNVHLSAKGPVIFSSNGQSILQKDVVITQPGRIIRADKAIILRDTKTGKISDIQLIGHVSTQEYGKHVVSDHANLDVENNIFKAQKAAYFISGKHHLPGMETGFDAWGSADSITHLPNNVSQLNNATYSTCSPENPTWIISAKQLKLDRNKGKASAKDVVIRFEHVPIFWAPYYSFAINKSRKSGFLTPSAGYATDHGFYFSEPFYWNMAPNYDLLLTPIWYAKRGVMLDSLFRYLTPSSSGHLYTSFIPDDRQFNSFKQGTLNSFSGATVPTDLKPYLSALNNMSDDRAFFDFQNATKLNKYWHSEIALRYASDPYFPRDFSGDLLNDNTNQLPSYARLTYEGLHWQNTFLIQTYQTLHSIDHYTTPAQNQYTRLPEFDFIATYPQFSHGFNFDLNAQYVHFNYFSSFYPYTYQRPIGDRIHLAPSISHPFNWSSGYITPAVTLDSTSYFVENSTASATSSRPAFNANRTLPILNVDSGLYFARPLHFHQSDYLQTLEPRFFYLYTPYLNQDRYPNFDTQLFPFSFSNLYALNGFTGFDRLQNANQMSVGVTSRIISEDDNHELLNAQLGLIKYFSTPRVCLLPGCSVINQSISPIGSAITFSPNTHWSFSGNLAWDTEKRQIDNGSFQTSFHTDNQHILVLGYQFVHGNADTPFDSLGFSTNSSLLTAGLLWPVTNRLHFFGYTYYNLSHHHPETQYVGLSYNTCCFALRTIVQFEYDGTTQVNGGSTFQNRYNRNYYVEFLLKGLGSEGNNSAESLLTSTLPGFKDVFSNKGHFGYSSDI